MHQIAERQEGEQEEGEEWIDQLKKFDVPKELGLVVHCHVVET